MIKAVFRKQYLQMTYFLKVTKKKDKQRSKGGIIRTRHAKVVCRQSTDIDAIDDPFVVQGLKWIRAHLANGISAASLAKGIGYSPTALQQRFVRALGATVSETVRQLRLSAAKDLLIGTSLSVDEIAHKCGFSCTSHLCLRLREAEGVTPLVYRKRGAGTFATRTACSESGRIGLIMPSLSFGEIFPPICQALTRCAQQDGYSIVLGDISSPHPDRRAHEACKIARAFVKQRVAGVLFQPLAFLKTPERVTCEILALFRDAGIPVVLLDSDIVEAPQRSGYDLVSVNHFDAGRRMACHLREVGARRIAYLVQKDHAACVQERMLGVKTACEGLALAGKPLWADPEDRVTVGRFLKRERPDAIACYNDRQAAVLIKTLAALGKRVPDDLLVAGFDNVNFARLSTPTLTTLGQPCTELAELAYEMLRVRIRTPETPVREVFLTAPLVVRESTMRKVAKHGFKRIERKEP